MITVSGLSLGTAREMLAYNLSVEGIHTYHVGDAEVLVHNTCPAAGMLGVNGTQTFSTTLTKPGLKYRVDVENPAPGIRPGPLHFQQGDAKYLYDFDAGSFVGMPNSMQKVIARDPNVARAIEKGRSVLGFE